jgi:carbamate kinase
LTTVVALGGHSLAGKGVASLQAVLGELPATRVVLTHGNGPQVGDELLRDPEAAVHVAVARTQGEIGATLACVLGATAVVTHVVVDEADPAFAHPTKPVGRSYSGQEARELERERGWRMAEDPGRGHRRVVASPAPREVVELEAVRALLDAGVFVVACGGGGIPVVVRDGALAGVDAVIDKDRASALLALGLGAERLVVLTDVDAVYRDYRSPRERALRRLTPDEAEELLPELAEGSMRPKVESCAAFVRATGGEALITAGAALADALAGRAGTRVAA